MSSFHEYHSVCIVMIVAKIHGTLSVTSTLLRGCFVFTHGVFMTILRHSDDSHFTHEEAEAQRR